MQNKKEEEGIVDGGGGDDESWAREQEQEVIPSSYHCLWCICTGGSFTEDESYEIRDKIFEEFNTLSVIYGKPAEEFIRKKPKADLASLQNGGNAEEENNAVNILSLYLFYFILFSIFTLFFPISLLALLKSKLLYFNEKTTCIVEYREIH